MSNRLTSADAAPIGSASLERGQKAALLVLRLSLETERQARGLDQSRDFGQ
jgi:hypothetical protein